MAARVRPLSDLLPLVRPHALACSIPFAMQALRIASIRFCERTRCWRHIASYNLTEQGGAVVAPYYATIHQFETADLDGMMLEPTQYSHIEPIDRDAVISASSQPRYVTQVEPGTVSVYPFKTGVLHLSLFLKPRIGNDWCPSIDGPIEDAFDVVPEFLIQQHGSAIAEGALEAIFMTPAQPFTDYNLGADYRGKFEAAMDGVKSSAIRGQQRAPLRVKPQWI